MTQKTKIKITQEENEMFHYLNVLRESGVTNMLGASPYIVENFDISRSEARKVLSKWMENFNPNGYEDLL